MNPAQLPPHSPPLVFDVVFGEPCLKKFFCSFEVALCFPLSFCYVFLFYLLTVSELGGKQAGVEQDTRPTYATYHVLYL